MKSLILILSLLLTDCVLGQTLTVDKKRLIRIEGTVTSKIIEQAKEIDTLSSQSTKNIYIFINSGGGDVSSGMVLLNAMILAKARGVKFICAVSTIAASMAFIILNECDQRYAFPYSLLLWHPIKVGGFFVSFSADEMEYLVYTLRAWEIPLNNRLIEELGITKEVFYYHYAKETFFTTLFLQKIAPNYIKVITNLKGVSNIF